MDSIWKQLPNDISVQVLSYGDPEVFKKFKLVLEQIEFLKKEFQILRNRNYRNSIWRYQPETNFLYYVLRSCYIKNFINKKILIYSENYLKPSTSMGSRPSRGSVLYTLL